MDLEQLTSFIRYQKGQKQGWDALDEVLTVVLESKGLIAEAEAKVSSILQQVESKQLYLNDLDATGKVKEVELTAKLEAIQETADIASKRAKDALQREINEKVTQSASLDRQIADKVKASEALALEINDLQADKSVAQEALKKIKSQWAEIKDIL